jgi:putative RecB family exonuclease
MTAVDMSSAHPEAHSEVAAARPWALSPSRAGDFMTCPLLYRLRVIDRLPEPSSQVTTRGTLVHGVLERLFDSPAPERTLEVAAGLLEPEWLRLLEERPELIDLFADVAEADAATSTPAEPLPGVADRVSAWLVSAGRLLATYFQLEDPTRIEPAERELLVEVTLDDGVRLRGFVDRVDVAPSGQTRIVDYKTGSSPPEYFEAKALFQLKFYALVMWRVSGTIPALLQLIYLGDGQVLRYAPDEADLLATERKVRALWAAIERALANREFPARRSRLCDWCAHQSICPEFGGTPPAFPEASADNVGAIVPLDAPAEADDITP